MVVDFLFLQLCSMILTSPSSFTTPPSGIISLVPSQTELLYRLGLDKQVIGITKFCVHPKHWLNEKQRVGGTKNPNIKLIQMMNPDLILANYEENRKEDIEELAKDFRVWITDVDNPDSALNMITDLGTLLHRRQEAENLGKIIIQKRQENYRNIKYKKQIKAAYLIWKNPYMTVGYDTFIHSMLLEAGLINVFSRETRYPQIDLTDSRLQEAVLILLSTEPYPFSQKDKEEMKMRFPDKQVIIADGEMFSWYGSRLIQAFPYISELRNMPGL